VKRHASLLKLSREHHVALVLAQRIANASDKAAIAGLMEEVPAIFRRELDPHFRTEETALLPLLERAGENAVARRTLEEHRLLRGLAARVANGDQASLKPFGNALSAHVRFEERELFAAVEAMLPAFAEPAGQLQQSG
jgi:hypothetical protein